MFQDGSAPVFRANALAMQHPTLAKVRIGSTRDALQIFYAVAQGKLPMTHRRLDAEERRAIVTGNVYIWEERGANSEATGLGIERWTDGMRWSPSRVRDDFLFYHQKEMDPEEAAELPPTRWARTVRPRTSTSEGSPVDSPTESASTAQRPLNDPMRLIKQTYSVIVNLPHDRVRQISRKWHLTAYFTQATVNELRKVDEVLPTVPVVPEGWFRSARSGKQRQSGKTNRPIQFANSFGPDTSGISPTMDLQDVQMESIAGPSGSSPLTQHGHVAQPFNQQDFAPQEIPQYSPYRGQEVYDMTPSQPPPLGPPHRSVAYTAQYNGRSLGPQPLAHLSLPPPPSMPSYKTSPQSGAAATGYGNVRGREEEHGAARRREGSFQLQHRQQEERQSNQAHGESSITVIAPMTYDRTPSRPLPSLASLNSSPTPGHPYANALPARIQKIPSGPTPGRPSEYYEPPSALKTIPVNVSPSFAAGHRAEGEFGKSVAGGGVYRTPHSHGRAHSRHRSSPNQIAPHRLPLPPSPPAPMAHLGGGGEHAEPPAASDTTSVPGSCFASVSPTSVATSASVATSTVVTAAPSAIRLVDLAQFGASASASAGIAGEKERVLVPLGELRTAVYRRRDPMDDALLRRFSGMRTTPPSNMMEE